MFDSPVIDSSAIDSPDRQFWRLLLSGKAVMDMRRGALADVRVLELGGIGPGQYGAMLLADHGADVVRIARPGTPFPLKSDGIDLLDRGKRLVALNLKLPADLETARRLAAAADVVIEGWRPGVAERLGLGPDEIAARNPRAVYVRMTGWGQTGPLSDKGGHDVNYIALVGALDAFGSRGGAPVPPLNLLGDFAGGGLLMAFGVLAALLEARGSGRGQVVDAAMVDGVAHLMTAFWAPWLRLGPRGTNLLDTGHPLYGVYETADGRHMAVGALEPQFFATLLTGLGLDPAAVPTLHETQRHEELRAALAAALATRTQAQWREVFDGLDAAVTPVLGQAQAQVHPQNAARAVFVEVDGIVQPAPAPRLSRTAATPRGLAREMPVADCAADWGVELAAELASGLATELAPGFAAELATDPETVQR